MGVLDVFADSLFSSPITDWLLDRGYSETACLNKANASGAVTALDAKANQLAREWNPTGYFTPADIRHITGLLISASGSARAAVAVSPLSTSDADSMKRQANAYLDRNVKRAQAYVDAAAKAEASGAIVDAPAFKTFVTNSLVNISQAYTTAAMLSCAESWAQHALSIANDVIDTCKAAVGVVASGVENIVKVVTTPWLRYVTIGAGVILLGLFGYAYWRRFAATQEPVIRLLPPA